MEKCDCCRKELELDKPVYQNMYGYWYCSKDCFVKDNAYYIYPTLKEALGNG
ncbi:hypothetical protein [Lactobacillus jensenii]|uniref:hypothetical protein n=1 Tax=Lactobacillus jensenii TaxID=109790 RepID=UPI000398BE3C|nr:hypothetical protein [Lactobacillus jensenii]ERJ44140.1 hypothetical protein N581_07900 [Lactobacillus jensenii MD IIE-70(2)]